MKKTTSLLLLLQFSFFFGYTQCDSYCLNFEDTVCLNRLTIDTTNISVNTWQIGMPQKPSFDIAYSQPNAIVTDTITPYPVNDSSVFVIKNPATMGDIYGLRILQGRYNVQSDSLRDYGKMEFSPDNGITWVDLLSEGIYSSSYNWWTFEPVLTGNSGGWIYFEVILGDIGSVFDIELGDTLIYRFTFISDNVSENLGGLMFDNICFSEFVEGISEERFKPLKSKIFPNPSSVGFTIEFENPELQLFHLAVYNENSNLQFLDKNIRKGEIRFTAKKLKSGIYFYKLTNPETLDRSWGKFIVVE